MHSNPNREKMSPVGISRKMMNNLRTLCPCCGGSKGIRAAFRANPKCEYSNRYTGEIIEFNRMIGQKGDTLRNKR